MVIIEKMESLKTWLVKKLTPLCDADPNALAKYVLALIKKDKTDEELRKLCVDQLEVFLQTETGNFVTELFKSLSNKSYIEEQIEVIVSKTPEIDINELKEQKKGTKRRLQRPSPPARHRSRSPYDRRRRSKRSRSPRDRRGRRYRSHSGSPKKSRLSPKRRSPFRRSRSRSRSPYRRRRTRSLSSSRSSSRSPDSSRQKPSSSDDRLQKKKRCWDYDQKGFCVLGDNCPYDHGSNPVVVDDISSTSQPAPPKITPITAPPPLAPVRVPVVPPPILPPFLPPPMGFPVPPPGLRPPVPPPMPPPPPGTMRIPPPNLLPPPPRSQPPPGYNPEAPGIGFPQRRQVVANLVPISSGPHIPGIAPPPHRIVQIGGSNTMAPSQTSPVKRTIYNNAPPGVQNTGIVNNFTQNSKIIIRKIPPMLNNITKLNEHFSKFGAINNIQVRFENDPQTALVEYAHVNSARAAKRDTGAVMNNRFIMLHWYNPQASNGRPQQTPQGRPSVKERLGVIPTPSQLKYTAPNREVKPTVTNDVVVNAALTRTISNPDAAPPAPVQELVPKHEIAATKNKVKLAQQAAKEKLLARQKIVLQKKRELQKQKEKLLQAQMQQQKVFLNKLKTTKDMPANEKLKLLTSLKELTGSIDKLRTSIKGEQYHNPVEAKAKQKRTQKDLLDAELDLYNASTTGENTINLKQKLNQLKVEASSLGLVTAYKGNWTATRGRGRGGATFAPRAFSASANLDRRPRELRVTGFHDDEKDEVISHLARFGEIENFVFIDDDITCTVKFQTRSQAELASLHGPMFKNRRLIIVWNTGSNPVIPAATVTEKLPPTNEGEVPEGGEVLVVPENEKKDDDDEDDDEDESDNVNVHIGDVTVNYPVELEDPVDDVEDGFEDELDEDALLAADFDEDEQIGDFEDDDEIRSWRR